MIIVCDGVVRGDDALECSMSGDELAYFCVDKFVAGCTEVDVRIVALVCSLFCGSLEGDRSLTHSR